MGSNDLRNYFLGTVVVGAVPFLLASMNKSESSCLDTSVEKEVVRSSEVESRESDEEVVEVAKKKNVVEWILDRDVYTSRSVVGGLYSDRNGNGVVDGGDERLAYTLELPWRDNNKNVSCVPEGNYDVVERASARFGQHYLLKDVPDRSYILMHVGNFPRDTQGCILVGDSKKKNYVGNSRKTMKSLRRRFKGKDVRLRIKK